INIYSLNLSRLGGVFWAKKKLETLIKKLQPELIHTQGIRADGLLSKLKVDSHWVMTSHNYPPEDYLMKFGLLKSKFMVALHFSYMRKCRNVISCSLTIKNKLMKNNIRSQAIQNGVEIIDNHDCGFNPCKNMARPVFISVGSLIPRKNMELLISEFSKLSKDNRGSLVILGDGPLMGNLKEKNVDGVHLLGNVNNVPDYFAGADYFLSSSLSEGLPNTVLEALSAGLPVILSDIESHLEIARESSSACKTFSLNDGEASLEKLMGQVNELFDEHSVIEAKRIANEVFSAKSMSQKYQDFYKTLLEGK
ncbi:glycosyltransferase, partial [Salinivibrio sharmensis]